MTEDLIKTLVELPEKIDELTSKIQISNSKLREQVIATKQILIELGIGTQPGIAVVGSATSHQPVAGEPSNGRDSSVDDEIRQEQLRYLESRKAERKAALDRIRNVNDE